MNQQEKNLGCYIHIPFCLRKCLFCSFTVAIAQEHRMAQYVDVVIGEAKAHEGKHIHSLYLGGGTPGYLPDDDLCRLMDNLRQLLVIAHDAEITIETNPENVDLSKAKTLRRLGFTRVSLGVQTFDDRYLKFLGRGHNSQRAIDAFDLLRDGGFDNINVDLMYGFPKQTTVELENDIARITKLNSEHISLYTLTVEPNSRFHARQMKLDDDDCLAAHYTRVCLALPQLGFKQYEISNFAKEGFYARHNSHYWHGGQYIGLGVGAHGYLHGRRYWNTDKLQEYLINTVKLAGFEDIDERTQLMERICFGLRTTRGIERALIPADRKEIIDQWVKDGLLAIDNDHVVATLEGQLVLDEISVRLI